MRAMAKAALLVLLIGSSFGTTRIASAAQTSDASFAARCAAAGVVKCVGFEEFVGKTFPSACGSSGWPSAGGQCYNSAADGKSHAFLDQSVYASGDNAGNHAALRLDATGIADANITGDYFIGWPQQFGQNSHFYVQYRLRLHGFATSSSPWTSPSLGGDGWKTSLFAGINGPLCGNTELTTVNFYYENKVRLYTRCSNSQNDNFEFSDGAGGFNQQQGDFVCKYEDSNIQAHCATFHGDVWMTMYYDIQIGTYGSANSYVKAYVDYGDGKGYQQWINAPNYNLSGPGSYGLTDFTMYTTGKNNTTPSTTYSAWYDEFILSTQPIAAVGTTVPNAPLALQAN
jgi:hypothetical protein